MADTTLFDLAERRLSWLDKRQGLLAQNIANADTPNYRAHDLAPFADQLDRAQFAISPTRTSPLHMVGTESDSAAMLDAPGERSISGNEVQLDSQLTKVADTDANQELVSDLYKKYLGLYRTALGR